VTTGRTSRFAPREAYSAVLAGGLLLMLAANLPGHLSVDSIMQLYEGRMEVRETFAPAIFSLILRLFDSLVPGTGLYVTASGLLLYGSLISLRGLRPRVSWLSVPVALAIVFTPALLVYQGIVWRDVFFANVSVAGFVCLAHAATRWGEKPVRWTALAAALVLFALAAIVRQNGLIVVVMGTLAVAWSARAGGWRPMTAYGVGFLAAVLLLAQTLAVVAQPRAAGPDQAMGIGLRILLHYDIVAAVAQRPDLPLAEIDAADAASDDFLRANARDAYSPERVDFFDRVPDLGKHLWPLPGDAVRGQWLQIVTEHPKLYVAHRLSVFRWVFLTPDLGRCVPVHVGIEGPADKIEALKLKPGTDPSDRAMADYAARFYGTPAYSHLTYALLAVAVAGFLLLRRDPGDWAMAALMVAALGFAASFLFISIACDYRYLYFLDLAALAGLLHVAVDPGRKQRGVTP
jgi:hypothetical protein